MKINLLLMLFFSLCTFGQKTIVTNPNTQAATATIGGGGGGTAQIPNVIAFDYDTAGNQIKRRFIYISSGTYKNSNNVDEPKLIESDIYSDVYYYPNPVKEELFIKWENDDTVSVHNLQLYNMSGQLLTSYEDVKEKETFTINFQSYPQGFYELVLLYTNGEQKTLKIIKQ